MLKLRKPFAQKLHLHIRQNLLQRLWDKYVPEASPEYGQIDLVYLLDGFGNANKQAGQIQLLLQLIIQNKRMQIHLMQYPTLVKVGQNQMENRLRQMQHYYELQLRSYDFAMFRTVKQYTALLELAEGGSERYQSWQSSHQVIERQREEYRQLTLFTEKLRGFLEEYSGNTLQVMEKELVASLSETEYQALAEAMIWQERPELAAYLQQCSTAQCRELIRELEKDARIRQALPSVIPDPPVKEELIAAVNRLEREEFCLFYHQVMAMEAVRPQTVKWERTKNEMLQSIDRLEPEAFRKLWIQMKSMVHASRRNSANSLITEEQLRFAAEASGDTLRELEKELLHSLSETEYQTFAEAVIWREKPELAAYLQQLGDAQCRELIRELEKDETIRQILPPAGTDTPVKEELIAAVDRLEREEFSLFYRQAVAAEGAGPQTVKWERTKQEMLRSIDRMEPEAFRKLWEQMKDTVQAPQQPGADIPRLDRLQVPGTDFMQPGQQKVGLELSEPGQPEIGALEAIQRQFPEISVLEAAQLQIPGTDAQETGQQQTAGTDARDGESLRAMERELVYAMSESEYQAFAERAVWQQKPELAAYFKGCSIVQCSEIVRELENDVRMGTVWRSADSGQPAKERLLAAVQGMEPKDFLLFYHQLAGVAVRPQMVVWEDSREQMLRSIERLSSEELQKAWAQIEAVSPVKAAGYVLSEKMLRLQNQYAQSGIREVQKQIPEILQQSALEKITGIVDIGKLVQDIGRTADGRADDAQVVGAPDAQAEQLLLWDGAREVLRKLEQECRIRREQLVERQAQAFEAWNVYDLAVEEEEHRIQQKEQEEQLVERTFCERYPGQADEDELHRLSAWSKAFLEVCSAQQGREQEQKITEKDVLPASTDRRYKLELIRVIRQMNRYLEAQPAGKRLVLDWQGNLAGDERIQTSLAYIRELEEEPRKQFMKALSGMAQIWQEVWLAERLSVIAEQQPGQSLPEEQTVTQPERLEPEVQQLLHPGRPEPEELTVPDVGRRQLEERTVLHPDRQQPEGRDAREPGRTQNEERMQSRAEPEGYGPEPEGRQPQLGQPEPEDHQQRSGQLEQPEDRQQRSGQLEQQGTGLPGPEGRRPQQPGAELPGPEGRQPQQPEAELSEPEGRIAHWDEAEEGRERLRSLIGEMNRSADMELVYTDNQMKLPQIQELLRYIRNLDEGRYGAFVKELAQITKLQILSDKEHPEALPAGGETASQERWQPIEVYGDSVKSQGEPGRQYSGQSALNWDGGMLPGVSEQNLWEWGEVLLFHPSFADMQQDMQHSAGPDAGLQQRPHSEGFDGREQGEEPSADKAKQKEIQTEAIRRQVEMAKNRNSLQRLIRQINHRSDLQLVYTDAQLRQPQVQELLQYIRKLDEPQYGRLVKQLVQITELQKLTYGEPGTEDTSSVLTGGHPFSGRQYPLHYGDLSGKGENAQFAEPPERGNESAPSGAPESRNESASAGLQMQGAESALPKAPERGAESVSPEAQMQGTESTPYGRTALPYRSLWEWGKALLIHPKKRQEGQPDGVPELHPHTEQVTGTGSERLHTEQVTGTGSERLHTRQVTGTGSERLHTEQVTETGRTRLQRLIRQIHQGEDLELVYTDNQPQLQTLLSDIQQMDEAQYEELAAQMAQIAKLEKQSDDESKAARYPLLAERIQDDERQHRIMLYRDIRQLEQKLFPGASRPAAYAERESGQLHGAVSYENREDGQMYGAVPYEHGESGQTIGAAEYAERESGQPYRAAEYELGYADSGQVYGAAPYEHGESGQMYEAAPYVNGEGGLLYGAESYEHGESGQAYGIEPYADRMYAHAAAREQEAPRERYPLQELEYSVQTVQATGEQLQMQELRMQRETEQLKSVQEQLDKKLKEVEQQLKRVEGGAKEKPDVRSFADQVKQQMYEELHVERLRRGLI